MAAQWMFYCLLVAVLLCLAAHALEGILRGLRRPTRLAWATALVLAATLPAAAWWLPRTPAAAPTLASAESARVIPEAAPAVRDHALPALRVPSPALVRLEPALRTGWLLSSGAALITLLALMWGLARRRRRWVPATVDDVPVLVSPDTGPAVVGLLRSRIVLPRWVVDTADPRERALLLLHEREHIRAG